jgi:hypothetical protein
VRVAHALKALPRISAQFRKGRLSYSKVRAMTRKATPKNEEYFLYIAHFGTAAHVERLVRGYKKVNRIEALERDVRVHELRELSWHRADDGMWILKGRFPAELGALLQAALEQVTADLLQERRAADDEEQHNECLAQPVPIASLRADALLRLVEGSATSCCEVHLHTDIDTLQVDVQGTESELEEHGNVSAETSRRLACDAALVHWHERNGEPLSIGRRSRTVPPPIRRALQRRDQSCRFPGCTCKRFVDAHHIHHWADGGETSLANLVLLCRHHHRLVHEGSFQVRMHSNGQPVFRDPAGKLLPENGETRSRGNVFELIARHRKQRIRITPTTALCAWKGELMDDNLAIKALLRRE